MPLENAFLLPFILHIALVFGLYVWLTVARNLAVLRGDAELADFRRHDGDPTSVAPIARNLANQFELPPLAWFVAVLLLAYDAVGPLDVAAAWLFLFGRIAHTAVQTLTGNVALRGMVFVINVLGVLWLVSHLAWLVTFGAPA